MDGGVSTAEDELRGSSDHFLTSLGAFWLHSVASCGSPDAAHLCVPAGLTLLSAVLLLLSSLLFKEAEMAINFLGNLCSTVGAVLFHFKIHFKIYSFKIYLITILWCSPAERRLRVVKRRRRQHFLAVGVLMVLRSLVCEAQMQIILLIIPKDSKEILGYILGLLASVIAWTSRFPALCRANLTQTFIVSGVLCSVSGALYTAAILLHDVRFRFLIRVMPWLLSSIGCVILDLLVSFCTSTWIPFVICTFTEITIIIAPCCMICMFVLNLLSLKEVTLSKDGLDVRPPHRMVRVVRVDGLCSSDTSYSSSSDSTDLEVGGNLDQK
uniref:Transmembrane protein 44 n=1 Tax=Xiphophorus maculatus TaxID=8083 RepID=A0A3B5PR65_XIPMA